MKTLLPLLLATTGLIMPLSAQNLLTNGNFETGELSPWTGQGIVSSEGAGDGFVCYVPEFNRVSQTAVTKPGTRYYLAADAILFNAGTINFSAEPAAGGEPDGKVTASGGGGILVRKSVTFTASSASTNVVLHFQGGSDPTYFDNVVLYELSPSKLAGRYTGVASLTVAVNDPNVANESIRKVTARITAEGRIVILDGTTNIYAGLILDDGTFDLAIGLTEVGVVRVQGKAGVSGKHVRFRFKGPSLPAVDEVFTRLDNTVTTELALIRVGR